MARMNKASYTSPIGFNDVEKGEVLFHPSGGYGSMGGPKIRYFQAVFSHKDRRTAAQFKLVWGGL
jgi:hypothetical protein